MQQCDPTTGHSSRVTIDIQDLKAHIYDSFQTWSRIPPQKLYSAFCWCSVVSCCRVCSAALPIVHFNCTLHKEQKYPLGTHSVTHTYKLTQFLILSYAQPIVAHHTDAHSTLRFSLRVPLLHSHTPEEQYLNLLFVLETEQRYSSDRSKMCFLAGISNSNVSNELEEKTSDWKRLGISK